MRRAFIGLVAAVLVAPTCWAQSTVGPSNLASKHIMPIINGFAAAAQISQSALPPGSNGIAYNGGPIMDDANGVNVYYIWYGDWSKNRLAQKVLVNLITHIGGSPYFNINTTYYSLMPGPNGAPMVKDKVLNAVHYMGSINDNYSRGVNLDDTDVELIALNSIASGALPLDTNGNYFVMTSPDVTEITGFCSPASAGGYCAWHANTNGDPPVPGKDIKIAFIGDAETQCPQRCISNFQTTMSGSLGADGMASATAHELEESVTDPDGTSWINADFTENADLCEWTYGEPYHAGTAADPYSPNMKFHEIPYLIQQNWVNAKGGYCAIWWDD